MAEVNINVRLLGHTPDPEKAVALAARMCYSDADVEQLRENVSKKDQTKFIKGVIASGHLSVIEHASFTFGVEGVSRALLAQVTRHRLASFSVKSQRYVGAASGVEGAELTDEDVFSYVIPPRIKELGEDAVAEYKAEMAEMQRWYDAWSEKLGGKAGNEDARFVLPNAAETKFVMTMNARELLHFFSLRCCCRAQWEIREMAWRMFELVYPIAPSIFEHAGPGCLFGACPEGRASCGRPDIPRDRYEKAVKGV